ncbi:hypothetical protein AAFC00_002056 [Neodothiora populina]|uniref:Armadillo-like helical domain-containing protein n=1 Tax=Neodothiora populina TaxID=2781224 RepID=A0ABR3PG50_9PEZI
MEQSPLTQQTRPDAFEPKVIQLYRALLQDGEDDEKSEGFWRELFLHKPDTARFAQMLDDVPPNQLIHIQHHAQQLLVKAVATAKTGNGPADENALDTVTVFLNKVLSKRYTNPSSDIIEVLAGLDDVDVVFTEVVGTLDVTIRTGRSIQVRLKAVRAALCIASGAFQTGLLTYFTQRDLFPSLMKLIHDLEDPADAIQPFLLAGLLANYNKFEVRNPYHVRFADFVNDDTIRKIVRCLGVTLIAMRDRYVAIQEDVAESWSLGGTLSYIGLGSLAGAKPAAPVLTEEEMKTFFAEQPDADAASLLAMYDFVLANKIFCLELVQTKSENKQDISTIGSFLSFCSYLYQHAHRSTRAGSYAHLTLFIIEILVEDPGVVKRLCENTTPVRLSRQRQPYLPIVKGDRTLAANIIDIMMDSINHNLRKRLDIDLYVLNLGILLRLMTFLSKARIRLSYHWPELWRSMLSFMRFLTAYATDLKSLLHIETLIANLTRVTTLALTQGESFLPDMTSYDDLVYKLVETGDSFVKFRDAYSLTNNSEAAASMKTLIGVSKHYADLIEGQKGMIKNLSPREVGKIIKQGYETLSIESREGLDHWERFREADHKVMLKKLARVAVADARNLSLDRE